MRLPTLFMVVIFQCCLLPAAEAGATNQTSTSVAGSSSASKTGDSNAAPIVIFDALWKALQDNYPMMEYAGARDEWLQEFKTKITAAPSRGAAFELMDELVCRLNDYHTRLSWPDRPPLSSPPFKAEPVFTAGSMLSDNAIWEVRPPLELPTLDGVVIEVVDASTNCGVQAGDEIVSVDGVSVGEALARAWPHVACSSAAGKLRAAAGRMLQGKTGGELKLGVRRHQPEGGEETVAVTVSRSRVPAGDTISSRDVDGVPVIRIARWSNARGENLVAQFDKVLNEMRARSGIIIDVRGNGGGQDNLASQVVGRFIKTPVIASISFHRVVPGLTYERTVDMTQPRGPWRYEGRVAVLTDEGCMSACEHFVSGMAEAGALLCGTPTSGACGWIRSVDLPGGAKVFVSQTFPLHSGGIPSPLLGIAPHLWARRTLADLQAGKDTALRAALLWIKSNDPLPARMQPLSPFSR